MFTTQNSTPCSYDAIRSERRSVCGEFLRSIFFRVMLSLFVVVVAFLEERKKERRERFKFNKKEKIVIPSRVSSLLNSQIAPINGSRTTSCNTETTTRGRSIDDEGEKRARRVRERERDVLRQFHSISLLFLRFRIVVVERESALCRRAMRINLPRRQLRSCDSRRYHHRHRIRQP